MSEAMLGQGRAIPAFEQPPCGSLFQAPDPPVHLEPITKGFVEESGFPGTYGNPYLGSTVVDGRVSECPSKYQFRLLFLWTLPFCGLLKHAEVKVDLGEAEKCQNTRTPKHLSFRLLDQKGALKTTRLLGVGGALWNTLRSQTHAACPERASPKGSSS